MIARCRDQNLLARTLSNPFEEFPREVLTSLICLMTQIAWTNDKIGLRHPAFAKKFFETK